MADITEQQKQFIENYIAGRFKSQTQAAIDAGYSEKSAAAQASALMKNPKVRAYFEMRKEQLTEEMREQFFYDAVEARAVMRSVLDDTGAKDSDRLSAAKDLLDRAGFGPRQQLDVNAKVKMKNPLEKLSDEDLDILLKDALEDNGDDG